MQETQIHPQVAIRELEGLAEFWRQRALGYSQLSFLQEQKILELSEKLKTLEPKEPESNDVPVIKSKEIKNDGE